MHAYCLFCETQKCSTIAALIEHTMGIRCFSPVIIQRKWVKGVCEEQHHQWLPGYIFFYTDTPIKEPIKLPGIIRILGNGELKGDDLAFADMLYAHNGVMGTIRLAEVGQYCTVDDPLWQRMEGKVINIDRGRKRCCIEFGFDNLKRTVWLGYDLIKPVIDPVEEKEQSTCFRQPDMMRNSALV